MAITTAAFFAHVDNFIDYRREVYDTSAETTRSNGIDLQLFADFVKERQIEHIDGPAIVKYQYHLKKARKNSGPSLNRKIFTLKSYAKFLKLEEVEEADMLPFDDVLKVRGGYLNRPHALTREQVSELFAGIDRTTCLGMRDYAVYALMYQLGLRVGELHRLNLTDVDLQSRKLNVIGKGRRRRELALNAQAFQILSEWLAVRRRFKSSDDSPALFLSKKGKRLAIRTMEDNFVKLLKRVKFNVPFKITCHTLRHTFASHLNDNGEDILVIQSLLGHSSPRSTRVYIHPSEQRVREAMEKLPAVLLLNRLVEEGVLRFNFQTPQVVKRE